MKKLAIAIIMVVAIIFGAYLYYAQGIRVKNSSDPEKKKFIIQEGQSSEEISMGLEKEGLIKNSLLFDVYAWQSGFDSKLKSGEYDIPKNGSIIDIVRLLSLARTRMQNKITIIEGWNNNEIGDYLQKQNIVRKDDFLREVQRNMPWWAKYDYLTLLPKGVDLEGYLFPDTYLIYKDATVDEILQKMVVNFDKKLTLDMRSDIEKMQKSVHEIITLASIIEEEVRGEKDRAIVSGIFYKRLEIGMGLQADSTVNYITGKKNSRSSLDDISLDNPYNTYKYRGLPPGPIGNPGLEAIKAAIYPSKTEYLYFLTTPTGEVIYGKTFNEHVKAKQKYLN